MWVFFTLLLLVNEGLSALQTRYVNVECDVMDPSYVTFEQCKLKLLGRGIVALNVHAVFIRGGFDNCVVNLSLYRKFSGFRPFMFNHTYDYCKFMANPKKKLSFERIISDNIANYSNLNHPCPFERDVIVDNLVFDQNFFKFLPLPTGDYKIQVMAAVDKKWATAVKIYLQWVLD